MERIKYSGLSRIKLPSSEPKFKKRLRPVSKQLKVSTKVFKVISLKSRMLSNVNLKNVMIMIKM